MENIDRNIRYGQNYAKFRENIISTAENYYDDFYDIIKKIYHRYNPSLRMEVFHICAFYNLKTKKIYFGESSINSMPGCNISTHAEIKALNKLLKSIGSIKNISHRHNKYNLIVIRLTKTGMMGFSRPCQHCINRLLKTNMINIVNIYYSVNENKIIKEDLTSILNTSLTYISFGWMKNIIKKNFRIKK